MNKIKTHRRLMSVLVLGLLATMPMATQAQSTLPKKGTVNLLDNKLSYRYTWLGNPHKSVTVLPADTPTGDGMNGEKVLKKDITIQSIPDYPVDIKKAARMGIEHKWKLGVALYTFHSLPFPDELAKADSAGLTYIEGFTFGKAGAELKDSLIMKLSPSGIGRLNELIKKRGLKMESIYITGGKTIDKWKTDFDLAKQLNVKYVTAEPPINMWDSVDSLAGVYGIKVAIHNHWKGVSAYWSPDSVLAALKNHPNFGACPDLGHWPKSGVNPVEGLKKLAGHIIAIHLKDIAAYNDPTLKDVPLGKGVIDFPAVFKELKRQNYSGYLVLERDFEEKPSNLPSVLASVKYYHEQLTSLEP